MTETAQITVDDVPVPFEMDFGTKKWTADREIEEAAFPLIAELSGKRYELYSDGTFDEEELEDS